MEKQTRTDVHHLGPTATSDRVAYVLLGGLCAGVLTALPLVVRWVGERSFVPDGSVLESWAAADDPAAWLVRPVLGLLLGVVIAWFDVRSRYRLEVGPEGVVVTRGGRDRRRLERSAVVGVYREGQTVFIDGLHGRRLFAGQLDGTLPEEGRAAFTAHGYPYESE